MFLDLKRLNDFRTQPSEVQKKRRKWVVVLGSFVIALSLLIGFFVFLHHPSSPPIIPPQPDPIAPAEPQHQIIEGEVKEKSTLFKSLSEKNIPSHWIDLVISKLRPSINFKKIKGGPYRLIIDREGELVKFTYEAGPTEIYEIEKSPEGYVVQKKKVPLEIRLVKVVGEIRSSLFEAMDAAGEQDSLTLAFAEILAWEIDFYTDVKEGDRFKVLVEKAYKDDQFIQYGTIHALEYQRGENLLRGVQYKGEFYNEKGNSLKKAFLKVPLRFSRISSKFSRARRHPILGGVLPHFGVDYAAPQGTPVWAVADGTVVSCGWNGGFGKQVVLRHKNGYMTYYGHLSGFGPKIGNKKWVKQKQIIGYVGSTGLSTGPHLDYRISKDGRFNNPLKESFLAGAPIGKEEMEAFQQRRDGMIAWLESDIPYKKRMEENEGIP